MLLRRRSHRSAILMAVVVAGAFGTTRLPAQARAAVTPVYGRVVDASTRTPIAGAEVTALGAERARSDSAGAFTLRVRDDRMAVLLVRRIGYSARSFTIALEGADTSRFVLGLDVAAAMLDTVAVSAPERAPALRLEEFEARLRARRGGQFVTRADIERRAPWNTSDLLRGIAGVNVAQKGLVTKVMSMRAGAKPPAAGGGYCVMTIGVDGVLGDWEINDISPTDIHGIEVYTGPEHLPAKYLGSQRSIACGLIMIWTTADIPTRRKG